LTSLTSQLKVNQYEAYWKYIAKAKAVLYLCEEALIHKLQISYSSKNSSNMFQKFKLKNFGNTFEKILIKKKK